MKITFLVLHYKNDEITKRCVDALFVNLNYQEFDVVIVDNASNNGSYESLVEQYGNNTRVHFVESKENSGYARGNNLGFEYAKYNLQSEIIILINNDVIIEQQNFIEQLINEYDEKHFVLCGPDIVTPNGIHQNPFKENIASKNQIKSAIRHDRIVYFLLKIRIQRMLRKIIGKKTEWLEVEQKGSIVDFKGVLHGSCLVFMQEYISKFDGLYNGTFLYVEEEILCYILNKLGLRYSYCDKLQVIHMHGTSMKLEIKDEDKKKMVVIGHRLKSYACFKKIIEDKDDLGKYLVNNNVNG